MPVKYTTETFKKAVEEINPNKLILTKVDYKNSTTPVDIICGECLFEFQTLPQQLTHRKRPSGCPNCARNKTNASIRARIIPSDILEARFRKVHRDKYSYDWTSYKSLHENMSMACVEHGVFFQLPCNHESGAGCPTCGAISRAESRAIPYAENVVRSRKTHGDRYEYPEEGYTHGKLPMLILCKKHGPFEQWPYDHWDGHGCNACAKSLSTAELELGEFVESLGLEVERDVSMPSRRRLDIVCRSLNIALEYNGLFWHSEEQGRYPNYHLEKTVEAESLGLRLVHIFEDEWVLHKEKTKRWLSTLLGKLPNKSNARDMTSSKCDWASASVFLEEHHMQGAGAPSNIVYCLQKDSAIHAIMVFSINNVEKGCIELTRFCTLGNIRGAFGKLLSIFLKENPGFTKIISFSDKRWSLGKVYEVNGFIKTKTSPPNYWYVKGTHRFHRRGFQHKYLETKLKVYNPEMSEYENCKANGYLRVWDCGVDRWELIIK